MNKKIAILALCGLMGMNANAAKKECPVSKTDCSACAYTTWEKAELATAALTLPANAMYRYSLKRFNDGKRPSKPVAIKSMLDALRITNSVVSIYNNASKLDSSKDGYTKRLLAQKYTALWVLVDTVSLAHSLLPKSLAGKIEGYLPIDLETSIKEATGTALWTWINKKVDDNAFINKLRDYVLPALEESATLWIAYDNGKFKNSDLIKLYVSGARGLVRSLSSFLDADNLNIRKLYLGLFVIQVASMGYDVWSPPTKETPEKPKKDDDDEKKAKEAARLEAEKKAKEEAAKLEAEKKAKEEAARLEAEKKAEEEVVEEDKDEEQQLDDIVDDGQEVITESPEVMDHDSPAEETIIDDEEDQQEEAPVVRTFLNRSIEELGLPKRYSNALRKGGISQLADLVGLTETQLNAIKGIGKVAVGNVKDALFEVGFSLKDEA